MEKIYHGSCHCGRVRIEAQIDLDMGTTKCNCTRCWKKRWWGIQLKPPAFRLLEGEDCLTHGAKGGFCRHCGTTMFSVVDTSGWGAGFSGEIVSLSLSCLDNVDPAEILAAPVKYCDGLNNNWWNPPAETRYL